MAITTNIKNYSATHGKNEGGGGGTTIIMGGGNADIPADLNVTSINADRGDITLLNGKSLTFNDGQFIYLGANNGTVNKIRGDELKYAYGEFGEIQADKIGAKEIETGDLNAVKAWIETLNSKSITTEYLTVTKQAHFFELIIDKVRSVGGTLLMTQAQCVVDYAKAVDSNGDYLSALDDINAAYYDVFWLAQESNGRKVTNDWIVNDQAYCQSFNNVSTGVNYDVSNKYYWRLVTGILNDRYMNLSTGAELPLGQSQQATVNSVTITAPYLADTNDTRLDTGWHTEAQQITGVITGATWTETSGGAGEQTIGTMTTTNTVFGIQITPVDGEATETVNANYFGFSCTPARLNVGIYYTDGTSQYFVAPEQLQTSYRYETLTQAPIEAIVITNAEEVEWKLVHGIRLSNTDCDNMLSGYASIPSVGDNIAQLGYRWQGVNDTNEKSRGNAIIIAAYKTPDAGTGVAGDRNQYPIMPPSYAQYEAIGSDANHRFDLAYYRKTYMDANRSRFVGDFFAGDTGQNIEDMIAAGAADLYNLFVAYSNTADSSQAPANPDGTTWSKTTQGGVSWQYMGFCSKPITLQTGETEADAIARVEATLVFSDYDWTAIPGGTGTPGGHWVNAYKNTSSPTTPPAVPNVNGTPKTLNELPYDGWYAGPQGIQAPNKYTWFCQAFVNGSGYYEPWQSPAIRLSGEDGDEIESIYTRNDGDRDGDPQSPQAPVYDSNHNPVNTQDDWHGVDSNGILWTDVPEGVGEPGTQGPQGVQNFKYEYIAQRYKKNGIWQAYSPPVLWSNWGEKGRDGDGYEYIYCLTGPQCPAGYQGPSAPATPVAPAAGDDQYPAPWTDEPSGVTEGKNKEYVSTRKKQNNAWSSYSTPALWAQWVPAGVQGPTGNTGPQGPQGEQGQNGTTPTIYKLIDQGSRAYTTISINNNNEIIKGIGVSINYKIARIIGDSYHILTNSEIGNLRAYVKLAKLSSSSYAYYKASVTDDRLTYTWTNSSISDAILNANQVVNVVLLNFNAPSESIAVNNTELNKSLDSKDIQMVLDEQTNVQILSGHQGSIRTLSTGYEELAGPQGVQGLKIGYSTLYQNYQGIQGEVTSLTNGVQGLQSQVASVNIKADGIQSTVTQTNYDISASGDGNNLFGFNRGCGCDNPFTKLSPYLYGMIGWGPYVTVNRLGLTQTGRYVAGFDVRSVSSLTIRPSMGGNTTYTIYDKDGNPINGDTIATTSSFVRYYVVFDNVTDYINDGEHNGKFFFGVTSYSGGNPLYVRNLQIIKDDNAIRPEFSHAAEDIEYAGSLQEFDWEYDANRVAIGGDYRGLEVLSNSANPTGQNENWHLIWKPDLTIKNLTPYTLSFWAKSSSKDTQICTNLYRASLDYSTKANRLHSGTGSAYEGESIDGGYMVDLGIQWQHYVIHWMTNFGSYNESIGESAATAYTSVDDFRAVAFRMNSSYSHNNDATVEICGIVLQEGWVESFNTTSSSFIKQTSNSITLGVQSTVSDIKQQLRYTGIDIESGQITIDSAHTIITGDDLVLEQNQGITIKDGDNFNNICISGKDIPSAGFGNNTINYITQTDVRSDVFNYPWMETTQHTHTWDASIINGLFNIGKLGNGSTITLERPSGYSFTNPSWSLKCTNSSYTVTGIQNENDLLLTLRLWEDSTNVKTMTIKKNNVTITGDLNYTVTSNGHSYKVTAELSPVSIHPSIAAATSIYASFNLSLKVTATNDNAINMGTNGMNIVANPYNMQINNTNGIILENTNSGKSGIKIDNTNAVPLQKASNGNWVTNGNIKRVYLSQNQGTIYASDDYDFYIFNASSAFGNVNALNLTHLTPVNGRTLWVKVYCNDATDIVGNNNLVAQNSRTTTTKERITYTGQNIVELIYATVGNTGYWFIIGPTTAQS